MTMTMAMSSTGMVIGEAQHTYTRLCTDYAAQLNDTLCRPRPNFSYVPVTAAQ
jgi:hypothetical protein